MKNYILLACAAFAVILSFLYEKTPSEAATNATLPAQPLVLLSADSVSLPDSLIYRHYSKLQAAEQAVTEADVAEKVKPRKRKKQPNKLLAAVNNWIGTPYSAGGNTKNGTDCSGFVQRIYRDVYGIAISRSSRSIFDQVRPVAKNHLKEGDILFFKRPNGPIYHVGIYLKDGRFIHSASNGGVMVNSIRSGYYKDHFYAGGRVPRQDS